MIGERRTNVPGENRRTLIILSTVAWDFLWQRHQIVATYFARLGWNVVYVQGISGAYEYTNPSYYLRAYSKLRHIFAGSAAEDVPDYLPENVSLYNCLVAPVEPRVLRLLNARFFAPRLARSLRSLCEGCLVVLNYHPTDTAREISFNLEPDLLIYDCVMNYEVTEKMPPDILETERWWLEKSDLVFVDSSFLKDKHEGVRSDMIRLPPGVDFDLFGHIYRSNESLPERYSRIGYFGGMGDGWFDFDLVHELAERGYEIQLVGESLVSHVVFDHPNVTISPPVSHRNLPALMSSVDALLMPYRLNEFTKGVFPSKTYEYLATGKPVLSTRLPDLVGELSAYLYFADDARGFDKTIRSLPETETPERITGRISFARQNSWDQRLEEMEREIEEHLRSSRRVADMNIGRG